MVYLKKLGIFAAIVAMVASCTEIVDVKVPNGGDRLVVEASINWEKATEGKQQVIKLSMSTPFFSKEKFVPVTSAKVSVIKNDDLQEISFESNDDGTYNTNNFVPKLNQSYTLKINYNGKVYEATETLIPVPEINRVAITKEKGFSKETPEMTVYFDDPSNERNFYLGTFYLPNTYIPELGTFDDKFQNGTENDFWFEDDFEKGEEIVASLAGLSEAYYYYLDLFFNQQGGGGPFQTTPAQMVGNCKNINDPKEEVFGYFSLSEVVTVSKIIE